MQRVAEFAKRQAAAALSRPAAAAPPTPPPDADAASSSSSSSSSSAAAAAAVAHDPYLHELNKKHPYAWIRPKRSGRASTIYLTRAADPPVEHGELKEVDIDDEEVRGWRVGWGGVGAGV